ncbi:MAG: 30S ribosomal protein S15 [Wigglesworthia glossinidia]|nr:30S ribosomal protein S15 [Wigglesworthia glossinidia]
MLQNNKKIEKTTPSKSIKQNSNKNLDTKQQITILTQKISKLQQHFIKNKKDRHSRRGLLKKVSRRRKLLNYLKNKNFTNYSSLIKTLQLRS